jgi:ATP/maltotriose-dependent transcriptional regulator MalT
VDEAIRRCHEILASDESDRFVEILHLGALAELEALRGRLDEARRLKSSSLAVASELGWGAGDAYQAGFGFRIEMVAGDPVAAEREARVYFELHERSGAKAWFGTAAAQIAFALVGQGRYAEADELAELSRSVGTPDDTQNEADWRRLKGTVLAQRGEHDEAERLLRDAVGMARTLDSPMLTGDTLVDLAEVLVLAGRPSDAVPILNEAAALYERKGAVVSARRARGRQVRLARGIRSELHASAATRRLTAMKSSRPGETA